MIAKQTLGHKRLSFFMLIDNYCNQICKVECATALSMKESKIIKLFCQFHIFLTACMRHAAVLHFSFCLKTFTWSHLPISNISK